MSNPSIPSANFGFLAKHDVQLVRLGALAERYFGDDPNTALIKLRQFGELLAQLTAAKAGLFTSPDEQQSDLLRRLKFERVVPAEVADLFHQVRIVGNKATHDHGGDHAQALTTPKIARQLGVWYFLTFIDKTFKSGPFVPPADPAAATKALHEEMARLRQIVDEVRSAAETAKIKAETEERARLNAEERAECEREERTLWEQLAGEAEEAKLSLSAQLEALQAVGAAAPPQATAALIAQAEVAAAEIDIDEAATRTLIDAHLRARGWDADTQTLRHSAGVRPTRGRNLAIAEWPTKSGPADYALFVGTRCIAVVEAKRQNKNVSAFIDQAQRYARGFRFEGGAEAIGGPWVETDEGGFLVPFVFSANGRPYLKQVETQSGIWFRDARKPSNHRRALVDWPTPEGLQGLLEIDAEAAQADLKARAIEFAFPLRPYQKRAIEVVEAELATGRRAMLLAMATGTGKTKLAIALLYRVLAAKRFRRVCFVVDRSALGTQAAGEFATTRIVSAKTFADIFGLKGLDTAKPDPETKVHICTIQGTESPGGFAKLKAMEESGQITHTIFDLGTDELENGIAGKLLEKLDYNKIKPFPMYDEAKDDYGIGTSYFSTIMAWRKDVKAPSNWADFFDTKNFPGKRGLPDYPGYLLPFAALADGVPVDHLYPLDLDRAFKTLKRIKDDTIWWQAGSQPPQLLLDKEVDYVIAWSGRVVGKEGVRTSFNQGMLDVAWFGIAKGADPREIEAANLWFQMGTDPKVQACIARLIPYTGPSPELDALLPQDKLDQFPTTAQNKKVQWLANAKWWRDNASQVERRWQEFKLQQ